VRSLRRPASLPPERGAPSTGQSRASDPDIAHCVAWFSDNQEPNGLWNTGRNRPKDRHSDLWITLAVCRMLNVIWTSDK
jgi:hypothetical protein